MEAEEPSREAVEGEIALTARDDAGESVKPRSWYKKRWGKIAILTFLLVVCGLMIFAGIYVSEKKKKPETNTGIIGGYEAAEGRYSYAVSINDKDGPFCGGSLISRDVVLSAAHCAGGMEYVVIGRRDLSDASGGEEVKVKEELMNPDYNNDTTENDIMLVLLERSTKEDIELVRVNSVESLPLVGAPVTSMGWGDTNPSNRRGEYPEEMMAVEVFIISNEVCEASKNRLGVLESYEGQITEDMMCAEHPTKDVDSCSGDSGGPLVRETGTDASGDVQVAVVSWGYNCADPNFPGVYSRTSSAYEWIRENVCEKSSEPDAQFNCDG